MRMTHVCWYSGFRVMAGVHLPCVCSGLCDVVLNAVPFLIYSGGHLASIWYVLDDVLLVTSLPDPLGIPEVNRRPTSMHRVLLLHAFAYMYTGRVPSLHRCTRSPSDNCFVSHGLPAKERVTRSLH